MATMHIALLRGVNVGGKNKLRMADLAKDFTAAGCADVRTYIQSGNVVFAAPRGETKRIARFVTERIGRRLGFRPTVVIRTAAELEQVAKANPFLAGAADAAALHVAFLADEPEAGRIGGLDPQRSPGDFFQVVGREVYLHLPGGMGRTKLTSSYLDSTLATISTARNWRTVLKLVEMARGVGGRPDA